MRRPSASTPLRLGEATICEQGRTLAIEKNIARFHVAVEDDRLRVRPSVQKAECTEDVVQNESTLLPREWRYNAKAQHSKTLIAFSGHHKPILEIASMGERVDKARKAGLCTEQSSCRSARD